MARTANKTSKTSSSKTGKTKRGVESTRVKSTTKVSPSAKARVKTVKTTVPTKARRVVKTKRTSAPTRSRKVVNPFDGLKPIRQSMTKTDLIARIADNSEVQPRDVKKVMGTLENIICRSIMNKGAGEFMFSGLFKIVAVKVPAKKGGEKKPNPFKPGETYVTKSKPATVRVKVRPLIKLKKASLAS